MIRLHKTLKRFRRNNDGANALEFAMLAPALLFSMFGIFHVAVFFFSTHQAQRASELTGREVRMMNLPSEQQISDALTARLSTPVGGSYRSTISKINEHGGTFADIRVAYEYKLPIPLLGNYTFKSQSGTRILLRDLS